MFRHFLHRSCLLLVGENRVEVCNGCDYFFGKGVNHKNIPKHKHLCSFTHTQNYINFRFLQNLLSVSTRVTSINIPKCKQQNIFSNKHSFKSTCLQASSKFPSPRPEQVEADLVGKSSPTRLRCSGDYNMKGGRICQRSRSA